MTAWETPRGRDGDVLDERGVPWKSFRENNVDAKVEFYIYIYKKSERELMVRRGGSLTRSVIGNWHSRERGTREIFEKRIIMESLKRRIEGWFNKLERNWRTKGSLLPIASGNRDKVNEKSSNEIQEVFRIYTLWAVKSTREVFVVGNATGLW